MSWTCRHQLLRQQGMHSIWAGFTQTLWGSWQLHVSASTDPTLRFLSLTHARWVSELSATAWRRPAAASWQLQPCSPPGPCSVAALRSSWPQTRGRLRLCGSCTIPLLSNSTASACLPELQHTSHAAACALCRPRQAETCARCWPPSCSRVRTGMPGPAAPCSPGPVQHVYQRAALITAACQQSTPHHAQGLLSAKGACCEAQLASNACRQTASASSKWSLQA